MHSRCIKAHLLLSSLHSPSTHNTTAQIPETRQSTAIKIAKVPAYVHKSWALLCRRHQLAQA